jgi:hypothetical protein
MSVRASHAVSVRMLTFRSLLVMVLMPGCAPGAASDADSTMTCGDAPGDTPMQACIEQNLALRDQTVRTTISTLAELGVARARLDTIDQRWRSRTLVRCGPRPDSVPPAKDSARAAWSCYSGAFNEHLAVLRDLRPR